MTNLDDVRPFGLLDTGDMAAQIEGFAPACAVAWDHAQRVTLPAAYRDPRAVVILGMGGSAISGDLARTLGAHAAAAPIEVVRGYHVPGYVNDSTLAIAISFSGNTEETLAAYASAEQRGACLLVIASGGELAARAHTSSVPQYLVQAVSQPRAALPHLYLPVIHALTTLGVVRCEAAAVSQAIDFAAFRSASLGTAEPERTNLAKQLARKLHGSIASIYGAEFLGDVARRWKTQINENSKQWAEFDYLPELNHNAVVGYAGPAGLSDAIGAVLLDSARYHRRTRERVRVTEELLRAAGIAAETVVIDGPTPLAQQLYGILLGDFVSFYLAMLNGVNPTPVAAIDYLKECLARA